MSICKWPADLDDGYETATGHCVEVATLTDRIDGRLIVLKGDFDKSHCFFLAIEDLENLEKAVFTPTEKQVLLCIYEDAVSGGALLLFNLFTCG